MCTIHKLLKEQVKIPATLLISIFLKRKTVSDVIVLDIFVKSIEKINKFIERGKIMIAMNNIDSCLDQGMEMMELYTLDV